MTQLNTYIHDDSDNSKSPYILYIRCNYPKGAVQSYIVPQRFGKIINFFSNSQYFVDKIFFFVDNFFLLVQKSAIDCGKLPPKMELERPTLSVKTLQSAIERMLLKCTVHHFTTLAVVTEPSA